MEVEILYENIQGLAKRLYALPEEELGIHDWRNKHFIDSEEINEIIQSFFIGNAINFKFWYSNCNEKYEYDNFTGSVAMWYFLKQDRRFLDADYLSHISLVEHPDLARMPMPSERIEALREAGSVLKEKYRGNAIEICESGDCDAVKIVETIIKNFPLWQDEQNGFSFNKRAQLFVTMVSGRLGKRFPITNIDKLTCLADYQVPKILRHFGVLAYSEKLSYKIEHYIPIESDSTEEYEIRKSTIDAVESLSYELKKLGKNIVPVHLDYILWKIAKGIGEPYHLTATIKY